MPGEFAQIESVARDPQKGSRRISTPADLVEVAARVIIDVAAAEAVQGDLSGLPEPWPK